MITIDPKVFLKILSPGFIKSAAAFDLDDSFLAAFLNKTVWRIKSSTNLKSKWLGYKPWYALLGLLNCRVI